MPISFDSALGIHDDALLLRSRRAELLASNIAHADTPNYKARDIDFAAVLDKASAQQRVTMKTTHTGHLPAPGAGLAGGEALYRVPHQASLDGNTVDAQMEHAAFAENTIQYQASLTFLGGRFKGLRGAIRGE